SGAAADDARASDEELAEARAALDALSAEERASTDGRMRAARLALASGQPDEAVRELAPLARRNGAPAPLLALYGQALLAAGQVEEAARAYASSEARDATLPEALYGRAQMAVRGRNAREAFYHLDRLDRALVVHDRPAGFRASALLLRARAQRFAGNDAEARRTFARVLATGAAPPEAYFHFAEAHVGHDGRAAREAFARYLELAPDGYYARRARRALGMPE
ncbi:MAG: hypothetical protein KF729_17450, partial [Sandaracinaceae bacterium]|nr:hypothetical protein [Sandaracinaceae bacterium]